MGRRIAISFLTLLYSMVLLHNSIYHHHHATAEEAALHHLQEKHSHSHAQSDSEGHEHSTHFIHAEDFGTSIRANIALNMPEIVPALLPEILYQPVFVPETLIITENLSPSDDAPPIHLGYLSARSLRGPPSFIA